MRWNVAAGAGLERATRGRKVCPADGRHGETQKSFDRKKKDIIFALPFDKAWYDWRGG